MFFFYKYFLECFYKHFIHNFYKNVFKCSSFYKHFWNFWNSVLLFHEHFSNVYEIPSHFNFCMNFCSVKYNIKTR